MPSVVQPWVESLTFKMQSVLFSSLRGCDNVAKDDPSKSIIRKLRSVVLQSAEEKFMDKISLFMSGAFNTLETFVEDCDHYPLHFVLHLTHAIEIVGFEHPDYKTRVEFLDAYHKIVEAFHLLPETRQHLEIRLADKPYTEKEKAFYRAIDYSPKTIEPTYEPQKTSSKYVGYPR